MSRRKESPAGQLYQMVSGLTKAAALSTDNPADAMHIIANGASAAINAMAQLVSGPKYDGNEQAAYLFAAMLIARMTEVDAASVGVRYDVAKLVEAVADYRRFTGSEPMLREEIASALSGDDAPAAISEALAKRAEQAAMGGNVVPFNRSLH